LAKKKKHASRQLTFAALLNKVVSAILEKLFFQNLQIIKKLLNLVFSNEDYILQLLTEAGLVSDHVIDSVRQSGGNQSVIDKLIRDGHIDQVEIAKVLASSNALEFFDLANTSVAPDVANSITDEVARRYKVIPVFDDGSTLTLAIADPFDFETLDALPHVLTREINFVVSTPDSINSMLKNFYGAQDQGAAGAVDESIDVEGTDAPIIKLVLGMLVDAFNNRASDIHIEPLETSVRIRYRVDGKLIEVANHPKKLLPSIIARLKVMSTSMSIAEKRMPQDGRIQVKIAGKDVDLRVSSVPSNHGESIVMRILDKSGLVLGLPELGFFSDDQATFERLLGLPDGIILVTGPTGSGKTTTLYGCLNAINKPDKKIITVEDPVEYEMAGINQVMVRTEIGMTFSNALRAMLRQAPNIIMIGEIRDAETANIAINASLTGHLVFSTLHTNDAPSAVARLADIGVKRFLIASAVRAVLAQRLVRKLCPACKTPIELSDKELRALRLDASRMVDATIQGPVGCEKCRKKGFRGRMGIFEIFEIDDEVRHLINSELSSSHLRKRAREMGMRSMREDGIRKVLAGLTSAQEVIHVTMADAD
jgi:type II secretory ATPase GspE/PulE/Tfp pilus assembly ATPase PilB-like protein